MPRRARVISQSGYYHVVSRGIGQQNLFEEDEDYLSFLGLLEKYQKEETFDLIAYCLMDNHFHILLKMDSGLGRLMKKLTAAYVFYFNTKYERVGPLFRDRYKSVPVENDPYLLSVVRYIHNKPVRAGICAADQYRWSSWGAYAGSDSLVNTDLVLNMLGGWNGFLEFSGREDEEDMPHLEIPEKKQIPDEEAQEIIRDKLNIESGAMFQNLDRGSRDLALRKLKREGLSIRQIERLTGINRGVVQKA